jgi:hypothetical protein
MTALPRPTTPASVVRNYLVADYGQDWPASWELLCHEARDVYGGFPAFAEESMRLAETTDAPSEVDVEIIDARGVRDRENSGVIVMFAVTSDERGAEDWVSRWDLRLVREGGEFRVCSSFGYS